MPVGPAAYVAPCSTTSRAARRWPVIRESSTVLPVSAEMVVAYSRPAMCASGYGSWTRSRQVTP